MRKKKKAIKGVTCSIRNGRDYWYARIEGRRVYCGKGDEGYKRAIAARGKYEAKKYENRDAVAGLRVKKAEFRTLTDMANWYMQLPTVQRQKSYKRKIIACKHLLEYFGKRNIRSIESDDIEMYRRHRTDKGAAEATVNLEVGALSAMYNAARKAKKIKADMLPGEFAMVESYNPRRIITDEEFEALVVNADPDFADVLICGYESAMRSSEIAELRAYQVHLDERRISGGDAVTVDYIDLGIFDTKTGARRTVPVSPRLKEVLKRRLKGLEPEDPVFTDKAGRYYSSRITRKMIFCCKRAGIIYGDKPTNEKGERIGVVFHCLRHTRTTKWVEMGFSDEIIRRATGHKSLEAYRNYVKLDPSVVMRLVDTSDPKRHKTGTKSPQNLTKS
jgi:integrase